MRRTSAGQLSSDFIETNETAITEVEIAADGRIYVFGASERLLRLLAHCGLADAALLARLRRTPGEHPETSTDRVRNHD